MYKCVNNLKYTIDLFQNVVYTTCIDSRRYLKTNMESD